MTHQPRNLAIVGATGAVGVEFLHCLAQRNFPVGTLNLLASYRSAGKTLPSQTLDQWWTAFNDPVLNDLVTTALAQAPDARLAAARLEEARAVRQGQIRELYLASLEKVPVELRDKYFKLYAYY